MSDRNIPKTGRVEGVSGSLVTVRTDSSVRMFELVRLGSSKRAGEIVDIRDGRVVVRVYENTAGLCVGEEALFTGELPGVDLGPGLLGEVLDGTGRPLRGTGAFGETEISALPGDRKWHFAPSVSLGATVAPGDALGTVVEGGRFAHRVLVPPFVDGGVVDRIAPEGEYVVNACVCELSDGTRITARITLKHRWELRIPRPVKRRLPPDRLLSTGQRILDALFPLARGAAVLVSGGFGTGKTLLQQALARGCDADAVVCVFCGGRGGEAAEFLEEISEHNDPRNGLPLKERTVLIAQTADMPPAARDTGICLGATVAEYYRDMGLDVMLVIDSLSRWAEALCEEEKGYLASRLSRFCERAGRVETLGSAPRQGSISLICSVAPFGDDFSDLTSRVASGLSEVHWRLDENLSRARCFPAIDCRRSRSLYDASDMEPFEGTGGDREELKKYLKELSKRKGRLSAATQCGKREELSEEERWLSHHAETVETVWLRQDARGGEDAFCSPRRSAMLLRLLKALDEKMRAALSAGISCDDIMALPLRAELLRLRGLPEEDLPVKIGEWLAALETRLPAPAREAAVYEVNAR